MDGYLKPKINWPVSELKLVELDDVEHVFDDSDDLSNQKANLFEALEHELASVHRCPRCKVKLKYLTNEPYCPECNWDSLTFYGHPFARKTA